MIASEHLRMPFVGAVAMGITCAAALVHALLLRANEITGWSSVAISAAIFAAFVFVFARAARSLARARRSNAEVDVEEALGDLARALELTGGLAVLAIVGAVLFTLGAGLAMSMS